MIPSMLPSSRPRLLQLVVLIFHLFITPDQLLVAVAQSNGLHLQPIVLQLQGLKLGVDLPMPLAKLLEFVQEVLLSIVGLLL
jgi:hypothetical protein